jgi:hypothetical protein
MIAGVVAELGVDLGGRERLDASRRSRRPHIIAMPVVKMQTTAQGFYSDLMHAAGPG